MRTALVTGSWGFVGRHMTRALRERGWDVVGCDIANPERPVNCLDVFRRADRVFDLVVHAAARAPHRAAIDGFPETMVHNQLLDAAMFEWALHTRQARVLYLSSSAAYPVVLQDGDPPHDLHETATDMVHGIMPDAGYGWTKLTGEKMAAAAAVAGLRVHVVRPFSGYGEDQGDDWPFGAFVARAGRREDPFTIWGDGSQVRDWIHIDDVVAGALAVVDADVREPVNLCTGRGTSMTELAKMITAETGYQPAISYELAAPRGVAYRVGDPDRFHAIYKPKVTVEEGVARAVRAAVTA
ncbi:NAD-dependent epimerase/dehydratase family protein [Streptomyces europaeiscabiei]|uniref:NAD-dependent epimerase/dehydratase family protein n=1 Tax=Streptomyces europaeiscabiei TaxID=146819 RepID=UPI0029BA2D32|nr:NAD-dependent epimerase/dehydratase family protein [Streptomyces europaeiscabiei]MDX3629047.1 NAD-dependent epimerase/dehydratase family protein [Streptomyces europaeiscabiei]MDX3647335.1 NAD-dependent epimerase/dehydratase family protein [Streptomyces europaeiscabiei]